jgi:hypothetical protein
MVMVSAIIAVAISGITVQSSTVTVIPRNSATEAAPLPLSGDKQRYRCADQNQKSGKCRRNAYLFKRGHGSSPGCQRLQGQEQRSLTAEVAVRLPTQGAQILGEATEAEPGEGLPGS